MTLTGDNEEEVPKNTTDNTTKDGDNAKEQTNNLHEQQGNTEQQCKEQKTRSGVESLGECKPHTVRDEPHTCFRASSPCIGSRRKLEPNHDESC